MHPAPTTPQAQGEGSDGVEKHDDVIPRVVVTAADASTAEEDQTSAAEHGEVHVKWKGKETVEGETAHQEGENDVGEEGEEEEEEEEDKEMTEEEKKEMYESVVNGDIDLLEDLLNKPNADINMTWFNENLLMAAMRAQQKEMAEFLLDNGINQNFRTSFVDVRENSKRRRRVDWYKYSCRQMAYDQGMSDIVDLIDSLNDELPYWIKPRDRIPRIRKPPPEPEVESEVEDGEVRSPSALSNVVHSEASSEAEIKDAELGRRTSRLGVEDAGLGGRGERRASCKSAASAHSGDSGCHSPRAADPDSGRHSSQQDPDLLNSPTSSSHKPRSGADDGYGTLSFKSSQCLSPDAKPEASRTLLSPQSPPPPYKWTKGAIQRQQLHHQQQRRPLQPSIATQPKVRAPGSYRVESSLWHQSDTGPVSRVTSPESSSPFATKPLVSVATRKRFQQGKSAEAKLSVEITSLSRAAGTAGHARRSNLKKKVPGVGVSSPRAPIEAWGEKGSNSSPRRRDSVQRGLVDGGKSVNRVPSSRRVSTPDMSRAWEDKSAALAARRQKRVGASHSASSQLGRSTPYTPPTPGYLRLTQSASYKLHSSESKADGGRGIGSGKASGVRAAAGSSLSLRPSLGTRNHQTFLSAFYLR